MKELQNISTTFKKGQTTAKKGDKSQLYSWIYRQILVILSAVQGDTDPKSCQHVGIVVLIKAWRLRANIFTQKGPNKVA